MQPMANVDTPTMPSPTLRYAAPKLRSDSASTGTRSGIPISTSMSRCRGALSATISAGAQSLVAGDVAGERAIRQTPSATCSSHRCAWLHAAIHALDMTQRTGATSMQSAQKTAPSQPFLDHFQAESPYDQPTMRAAPDRERRRQQVALPGPVHLSIWSRADGSDVGYLWIVVGTKFSQRQQHARTAWKCDGCCDEAPWR